MVIEEEWAKRFVGEFTGLILLTIDGQVLVGQGSLQAAIAWLRDAKIVVLGMEGFSTDGVRIVPMTDYIADFSKITGSPVERVLESSHAASRIATGWTGVPFTEFVVDTESD